MGNKVEQTITLFKQTLPYLFTEYEFRIVYLTPDYGFHWYGVDVGLASNKYRCRLSFARQTENSHIGISIAPDDTAFETQEDIISPWEGVYQIVHYLSSKQVPGIREFNESAIRPVEDLIRMNNYIKPYMDEVFALYEKPGYVKEWLQTQRELNKHAAITIEQIKAERVRLQSLGLDSSLKAALENLRGKND